MTDTQNIVTCIGLLGIACGIGFYIVVLYLEKAESKLMQLRWRLDDRLDDLERRLFKGKTIKEEKEKV